MLNRLITEAAEASPVIERINASADDLALCLRCFGLVSTSTSAFRPSSMPEPELRRARLTLDGSASSAFTLTRFGEIRRHKVLARSI